jgi:glycosyltransferase involved in cell wall biosynthesis
MIAISEGAKSRIKSRKIDVVFNGVDTDVFIPRDKRATKEKYGFDPEKKLVLFVGQMAPHKGIFNILKAAGLLPRDKYTFAFCGYFKVEDVQSKWEAELAKNPQPNIDYRGQIKDIEEFMAAADFLLLPSREGTEGMGRVIFEAMACGTVPIATDISGVREAVTPETGILVPEDSPEAIAEALEKLSQDSELYARMAKAGRKRSIEVFGKEKHAKEVQIIYERLLGRG